MTIIPLNAPHSVRYRECPGCYYLMSQIEIRALKYNIPCPGCRQKMIGEFVPTGRGNRP